ncbi:hypothetical protein [Colwellia sp. PAMC 21821]|uniref:hypothetical protein n=1 Tax=Colwellia sp. PAMC 21821 TaxID=1816219 RepID=UPI0009BFFADA|nr:hypothetical protein [Colwellia sp. PAMC 21821]ARD43527.1 hypothetical protein A3Q33_03925 [Colwellia sp. PAMC 21821]
MPTKNQIKKVKQAFISSPKANDKVLSAIEIAKAVIGIDIMEQHKKKILTEVQWLISEAHGKYTTKYRTAGVLSDSDESVQHEHVFPRKKLSLRILNDPINIEKYLKDVVGCVVTVNEHNLLSIAEKSNPELDGWDRYKAAGIVVYDMEQIPPIEVKF